MAGKKKNDEPLTVNDDLLEEEERKALMEPEEPEGDDDEEGKKDDDEGKNGDEEPGKKDGDEKGDGEGEEGKKGDGDEGDKEGDKDPLEGAKPIKIDINGDIVEGWISKSGKYIIPFTDVEKRDEARRTLKTANETLESANKQLEARIAELRATPPSDEGKEEKPDTPDFAAMGAKLYESEEGAAEVLKQVYEAGHKAGKAGVGDEEGSEEQKPVTVDPGQIAAQVESKMAFKKGLEEIVGSNEKLQNEGVQFICYQLGMKKLGEKIQGMAPEQINEYTTNADNLLTIVKEAAQETLDLIGGNQPTDEEKKADRENMRKEVIAEVSKSLNLSEADRRTLGDVSGGGGHPESANKELDDLEGEELEEALEKLSPQEKDEYLNPKT